MPDLTKLLPQEQLDTIAKLVYTGGPGDPQRDVRMLLQHIDVLAELYELEQRRAFPSLTFMVVNEMGEPLPIQPRVRQVVRLGSQHYGVHLLPTTVEAPAPNVVDPEIHMAMYEATKRSRCRPPEWAWVKAFTRFILQSASGAKHG